RKPLTSGSSSAASATSAHWPCSRSSRVIEASGWTPATTSAGRYVPRISRRASSRRCASDERRSSVESSLHCRSSSTRTSGPSPPVRARAPREGGPPRGAPPPPPRARAQHASAGRPLPPPLDRLELRVRDQAGHLDEPGRRVTCEDRDNLLATREPPDATERL